MNVLPYSDQTSVLSSQEEFSLISIVCKTVIEETLGKTVAEILEQRGGGSSVFTTKLICDLQAKPHEVCELLNQAVEKGDNIAQEILANNLVVTSFSDKLREKLLLFANQSAAANYYLSLLNLEEEKQLSENNQRDPFRRFEPSEEASPWSNFEISKVFEYSYVAPPPSPVSASDDQVVSTPVAVQAPSDPTKTVLDVVLSVKSEAGFLLPASDEDRQLLFAILNAAISGALGSAIALALCEEAKGDLKILEEKFRNFREDPLTLGKIINACALKGDEKAQSFLVNRDSQINPLLSTAQESVDILINHLRFYENKPFVQYFLGLLHEEKGINDFKHNDAHGASGKFLMALHLLDLASSQGYLDATYELGNLYVLGYAASQEYKINFVTSNALEIGLNCYKKAAQHRHPFAKAVLNRLHIDFSTAGERMDEEQQNRPRSKYHEGEFKRSKH